MKSLIFIAFLIPGILCAATISGRDTDKEGDAPLVGTNVVVVGTKLAGATDESGW